MAKIKATLKETAKYQESELKKAGIDEMHVCVTKGNTKLGHNIYTFSTLPGDTRHLLRSKTGELLCDVPGTCTGNCDCCFGHGCYAVNCARRYASTVIPAWARNTILMRAGKAIPQIDEIITKKEALGVDSKRVRTFRINVSGEIQTIEELEAWDKLARKHPGTQFGLYTKNYEVLAKFLAKHGETAPNFVINVSQWNGAANKALKDLDTWIRAHKINVFEYDDTNRAKHDHTPEDARRLAALPHCPAVTKSGKRATGASGEPITCDMCKRCYKKTGKTTAVYSH